MRDLASRSRTHAFPRAALALACLGLAGCSTQPLGDVAPTGADPAAAAPDSTGNNNELAFSSEPEANKGPTLAPPPPDYFVLKNRQKFIGIEPLIPGVDQDDTAYFLVRAPLYGALLGALPNVAYVPNRDFVGSDSFIIEARALGGFRRKTVNLSVRDAFVVPIGIPPPPFGVTQSHWDYANGGTYNYGVGRVPYLIGPDGPYTHYVDFQNGDDAQNPYGSPDFPRKTIPAYLAPGSVVELHGYGFDNTIRHHIAGDGTADRPIFIRGANALNKPVFRRPISIECNYVIVENLEFDCQDFVDGTVGAQWVWVTDLQSPSPATFHHIAVRHCLFRDQPPTTTSDPGAVMFAVSHTSGASPDNNTSLLQYLVAYDVEVRNFGQWDDFSAIRDFGGVHFGVNTQYGWTLDCHLHHLGADAIGLARESGLPNQAPPRNIYMGRNYMHHCKENAVDFKLAVDCVLSQNVAHTVRVSNTSLGDLVTIHNNDATPEWPACDKIWVLFNRLYDAEQGVMHENAGNLPAGKSSRSYIVGNQITDIRVIRGNPLVLGAAIHKGQSAQSRIISNTIAYCDQGIMLGLPGLTDPTRCTQVVRDNIIYNLNENYFNTTGYQAPHISLTPNSILPYTTIDHNLHWEDQGQVRFNIVLPGGVSTYYSTIAALQSATGFGQSSLVANPQFMSAADGNFHLQRTSPANGAGGFDIAYPYFTILYGLSMDFFLDGAPKPPAIFNIGALPVGE